MTSKKPESPVTTDDTLAAVDLGSNSFHMIVARISEDGGIQVIDKIKEMVRLGAGLDDNKNLSEEAQQRALECLERFGQRLLNLNPDNVKIVGTNTLRSAKNSAAFLSKAQKFLGHSIEIISGIEEARLIYLGVSHSLADDGKRRLVIDIGGGSTETIIGEKFTPLLMESHYMGCVSYSRRFFANGRINKEAFKRAELAAQLELENDSYEFIQTGWDQVVGASGTARSISSVLLAEGLSDGKVTFEGMKELRKNIIKAEHIDNLQLQGLDEDRRPVFVGGFAVMYALFKTLNIEEMEISDGAVREGLIYDLLGRIQHEDVREKTVARMVERYSVHTEHAENVAKTALTIYNAVAKDWYIKNKLYKQLLIWSALLHEMGLTIAHAGYHKHGEYLASNSDLPGFSFQEQQLLAALIRSHRQKFPIQVFEALPEEYFAATIRLAVILRMAVILHRSRTKMTIPELTLNASKNKLEIQFPAGWFETHALTLTDFKNEIELLEPAGIELLISSQA
jgi:exopolyphosphatase/guanosine-5'-triphosphate,3'-diphosphate pyrophosphatase